MITGVIQFACKICATMQTNEKPGCWLIFCSSSLTLSLAIARSYSCASPLPFIYRSLSGVATLKVLLFIQASCLGAQTAVVPFCAEPYLKMYSYLVDLGRRLYNATSTAIRYPAIVLPDDCRCLFMMPQIARATRCIARRKCVWNPFTFVWKPASLTPVPFTHCSLRNLRTEYGVTPLA